MNERVLIISGVHIDLTEAIKDAVRKKTEKLFNHEERIIRIRIELESTSHNKTNQNHFTAKGHIEIEGKPLVASSTTNDLYISIYRMVLKLDRKLRQRSRLQKVKRKSLHRVDIPSEFPKSELM